MVSLLQCYEEFDLFYIMTLVFIDLVVRNLLKQMFELK